MKQKELLNLLCHQNGFSYIIFDDTFHVQEVNNIDIKEGTDLREYLYEIVGMEENILALHITTDKDIQIPMILREEKYYDLRIEAINTQEKKLFVAYLQTQSHEIVQYTHVLQKINKKNLEIELEKEGDTLHQQILQTLTYASDHDTLTDLANRHAFLKQIDAMLAKESDLSLCFIDIDNFHTINTEYGAHAGDMLLKHLVNIINRIKNKKDFFARIYADTFALLPHKKEAKILQQSLNSLETEVKKYPLRYTQEDCIEFTITTLLIHIPQDINGTKNLLEVVNKELKRKKIEKSKITPLK